MLALYGTTGVLEAARRALNVVFDVSGGRSFLRRKLVDVVSTVVLMTLILVSLVLAFVGGRLAEDLLGFIGLGEGVSRLWNLARWPAALLVAMLVFSFVYYVTPDVQHRAFRWITPGAVVGRAALARRLLRLLASTCRGSPTSARSTARSPGAIVLVGWLWLTNVAMLFGAELNAEIERQKELAEGVPQHDTLNRPERDD